tara:strand:+ start:25 stop:165 length:141 start_codon:yes stop_codon:yes gene_type:complete
MADLQTKIDELKSQQEKAKEMFIMCKGAIEVLEGMLKEEKKDGKKK